MSLESVTTIEDVMNRLYVQWLTPPDSQDMQVRLGEDIDATQQTILIGDFTVPEDEDLLRQGSLLEWDSELVRVVSYDSTITTVTVTRGEYGTTPTAHLQPLLGTLNPPFARANVFQAISDNIITLYPKLYTVRNANLVPQSGVVAAMNDVAAVEVLTVWEGDFASVQDIQARIVDYHPSVGGRAVILNRAVGSFWIRYRRRMLAPTAITDTLEEVGVDERWVICVMAGAAADLLVGRDMPAVHTEWVKSVLEAENIKPGTRMSISGGLRQYRNGLVADFAKEMTAEYRPKIRMRNPFESIA